MEKPPAGAPMEKPATGEVSSDKPGKRNSKGKRMPTPRELVSHYEKQGMATQDASMKVIQDLQGALFRIITSKQNSKSSGLTSDKLDALHSRLLHLESKLDAKPSYPQALALGVASAGVWNAAVQIWNSVRQASSSSPSS